jgi:hypothetical protein
MLLSKQLSGFFLLGSEIGGWQRGGVSPSSS